MQANQLLIFGPYRFDPHTGQVWRGKQEVSLTGKAVAVLRYLIERAGQVVTKEELFAAVWPDTVVSDAALTSCIQELRQALKDDPKQPQYLKTIHRRGFQFVGALQPEGLPESPPAPVPQRKIERKLVAILSADVQGYSRLMSEDELATIRTLTAYREAMTAIITQHRGRVVDAPGDNLLAEFASAVDAVEAAAAIQHDLKGRNAELPAQRQMHYRIGINLGDVVVEGGRIYGDGVNIAARLEALAEGGGICLSRAVYEQVKNKVALTYEYVGERTVKNIAEPVAVYRVRVSSPPPSSPVPGSKFQVQSFSAPSPQHPAPTLVGREAEVLQLHGWLNTARNGARQVVFVSGEPGIGKTTVVETFLGQVAGDERLRIGRGQCVEHYGAGEAYLPILEALGRLCREEDGHEVVALLRQYAPSWLVQLPSVLNTTELEELQRRTAGVTRERMLRELAEALEALTSERVLILRVEDLHWSDYSTLDLLSVLARRHEAAKLFIIGTYRPIEVLTREHPLRAIKQELQVHGQCEELALDFLSEGAVAEYLARRFGSLASSLPQSAIRNPQSPVPLQALAQLIHQRTDGNPLFMVNVVNDLIAQGVVVQTNGGWELRGEVRERTLTTPVNLRQMIEQQIARVSPEERKVLEAASVAGAEFSAAAVAAGTELSPEVVETHCDNLVRREQFLRARETTEWPDGTIAAQYGFGHALYQEVLYEQLSASRRIRLHRQIGEREEQGYGERASEIAAELAAHFERGRDTERAIHYLQQAGENSVRRSANTEAISDLTAALGLLKTLPDTPERSQRELTLQIALGNALIATRGYTAPEVRTAYTRARALCQQMGETPQLFPVLWGLWVFYLQRAEFQTGRELAEQFLRLAQTAHDSALLVEAHSMLGLTLFMPGELASAQAHTEQGIVLYDVAEHGSLAMLYGEDPGVCGLCYEAAAQWYLGYSDRARKKIEAALTLARELAHPHSLANALYWAAMLHQFCREGTGARRWAEALLALCTEHGFSLWLAAGAALQGWALAVQGQGEEGITQLRQGLDAFRATGAAMTQTHILALLAEAYGTGGQAAEGLTVLAEALATVERTGERFHEAELYRLKGELTLQGANQKAKGKRQKSKITNPQSLTPNPQGEVEQEAEECFLKAIEIARHQQAKSLELRAVTSLVRLQQHQATHHTSRNTQHESRTRLAEAHKLLSDLYGWFTEGFDTKDLQEAKVLLDELM
jgi:class 3 adenylate cyclase/predicted ATPase